MAFHGVHPHLCLQQQLTAGHQQMQFRMRCTKHQRASTCLVRSANVPAHVYIINTSVCVIYISYLYIYIKISLYDNIIIYHNKRKQYVNIPISINTYIYMYIYIYMHVYANINVSIYQYIKYLNYILSITIISLADHVIYAISMQPWKV